jgi:iron complex transport system ATP-binding protein
VITRDLIRSVYGIDVFVSSHPITGRPYILPAYQDSVNEKRDVRVHVICGGGTGSHLLGMLHLTGCVLSAGVLNVLDSDYVTARTLGLPIISEAPFAPISAASSSLLKEWLEESDLIILVAMPVGMGNLDNLRMVSYYPKKTVILGTVDEFDDCTDGEATTILRTLCAGGGEECSSPDQVLKRLHSEA